MRTDINSNYVVTIFNTVYLTDVIAIISNYIITINIFFTGNVCLCLFLVIMLGLFVIIMLYIHPIHETDVLLLQRL